LEQQIYHALYLVLCHHPGHVHDLYLNDQTNLLFLFCLQKTKKMSQTMP
jgi:hypothetical protein